MKLTTSYKLTRSTFPYWSRRESFVYALMIWRVWRSIGRDS